MRLLVTGGRNYTNREFVFEWLRHIRPDEIVVGDQTGADELAREYARAYAVPYFVFPANWTTHGNAAGPIRNAQMLRVGKPDMVIAFPGGKGTRDMVAKSLKAGVPVTNALWRPDEVQAQTSVGSAPVDVESGAPMAVLRAVRPHHAEECALRSSRCKSVSGG